MSETKTFRVITGIWGDLVKYDIKGATYLLQDGTLTILNELGGAAAVWARDTWHCVIVNPDENLVATT